MLLQNADLTADTRNSIIFQLTTGAALRKGHDIPKLVEVDKEDIRAISHAVKETETATTKEAMTAAIESMKGNIGAIENRAARVASEQTPSILFSEAANAIKQVKITKEPAPENSTFLSKRSFEPETEYNPMKRTRLDEIKARTKCMACGRLGHWFKDNPRCAKMMADKHASKRLREGSAASEQDKDKPSSSFFRPRGQ